jgi:hypothetical protein
MRAIRDCSPGHIGDHAGPGFRAPGSSHAGGEADDEPLPALGGERRDAWPPWPGTQVGV